MTLKILIAGAAAIALTGCGRSATDDTPDVNATNQPLPEASSDANAADNAAAPAPAIDPKSPAGAKAVVEGYAALATKSAFAEAARYWTNRNAAAQFAATLEDYPKVALKAGTPVDEEGAMGSIYITVPLTLDLTLRSGSPYQMTCKANVRRINDVPGSTAEQRLWHIENITC